MIDALEDVFNPSTPMGVYAENTASKYGFSREAQDEFAIESLKRAQKAGTDGSFEKEIVPVVLKTRKGEETIAQDEQPRKANLGHPVGASGARLLVTLLSALEKYDQRGVSLHCVSVVAKRLRWR